MNDLQPISNQNTYPVASELSDADQLAVAFLAQYDGHSRRAYQNDLKDFARWCSKRNVDPLKLKREDLNLYRHSMQQQGKADATIARRLSALKGFYQYAVDEEILKKSPASRLRTTIKRKHQTLGLDRQETTRFLGAARKLSGRDWAIICLLLYNGLRVSEVYNADVADLTIERGHRCLHVTRKGKHQALVPLAPHVWRAIDSYLNGRQHGPLFIRHRTERRLLRGDIVRIVKRVARLAEIDKDLSPHSLRHTFVTLALDSGAALRDVQVAAGHADPRTTLLYDRDRFNLDRHVTYKLASYISPGEAD